MWIRQDRCQGEGAKEKENEIFSSPLIKHWASSSATVAIPRMVQRIDPAKVGKDICIHVYGIRERNNPVVRNGRCHKGAVTSLYVIVRSLLSH